MNARRFAGLFPYLAPEATVMETYVHGYSEVEAFRLADQARTLVELLHPVNPFPEGSRVLEAGCGVGAQTIFLAAKSPGAHFTSFDISPDSLEKAREKVKQAGLSNVTFEIADIFNLPYGAETFDHLFVCFLLEHLSDPSGALIRLKSALRKGGSITVIEGDHGSYYCHPKSREADLAVQCLVDIQARKQGNSLIGRQLYPLLTGVGFRQVKVSPRMVYVDSSKPELIEGFTRKTFIAMVEGVKEEALSLQLTDKKTWDKGIADLYRTTCEDGTFCYTFFTATGLK
jgi:ubiquinone/menaquinone biosynthesis C-methylase UbiE